MRRARANVVVPGLISAGDNSKQKTSGALYAAVIFDVCEFLNLVSFWIQDLEIGRCAIGCKVLYTH
jgi:hypothetical protein